MSQVLTGQQLQQIGVAMFGQNWRKQLAESIGMSYARISQLVNAPTIPAKPAARIISLHDTWKSNGSIVPVLGVSIDAITVVDEDANRTDEEILDRINKRFNVMDRMVDGMVEGVIRSLVVAGAPGIGKTHNLEKKLKAAEEKKGLQYQIIRGTVSAPGLYQALYRMKDGGILTLDDSDSVFDDEQAFNILKAALDTTNTRTIAWRKQALWVYDANAEGEVDRGEDNGRFPNEFEFNGGVIFITNKNFRAAVTRDNRMSPHFGALLSRSMYLDLTLHSNRARTIRIKDVFNNSMRKALGLTVQQGNEILNYVFDNAERIDELSLRTIKHIADVYKLGKGWQEIVEYTKFKSV